MTVATKPPLPLRAIAEIHAIDAAHRDYFAGRFHLASTAYVEMLRRDPQSAAAGYGLAISATRLKAHTAAIALYGETLGRLTPATRRNYPKVVAEIEYNLARCLQLEGETSKAGRHYREALELDPANAAAWSNFGNIMLEQGKPGRALVCYRRAIALAVDGNTQAQFNRSMAQLVMGQLCAGFEDYEARWRNPEHLAEYGRPELTAPWWDGTQADGRLLLWCEQGLGDTLQMLRYVPRVRDLAQDCTLQVQEPLVSLVRATWPDLHVIGRQDPAPEHAWQLPLMSLPYVMRTWAERDIPPAPYLLTPSSTRLAFAAPPGFNVGLCWAGSTIHPNDRQRSCPLALFEGLIAARAHLNWYSLQVGDREREADALPGIPLVRAGDMGLADFLDTGRLMRHLDLVITVDTAVAHLAGALGVPTWLLLPIVPDFRWQLDREDTPWYPTMRLFRPRQKLDWPELLQRVGQQLTRTVRQTCPSPLSA